MAKIKKPRTRTARRAGTKTPGPNMRYAMRTKYHRRNGNKK